MFAIPENVRQRLLLAHLTAPKLTQIFEALSKVINERGLNDACINLAYTLDGEQFGDADLLPYICIGLRKAVPTPERLKLELPL
jgi:hypothetical protein